MQPELVVPLFTGPEPPPPGLVEAEEHDPARPDELLQNERVLLAGEAVGRALGVDGQDFGGRLAAVPGRRPVQRLEPGPQLGVLGVVAEQPQDGVGPAEGGELGPVAVGQGGRRVVGRGDFGRGHRQEFAQRRAEQFRRGRLRAGQEEQAAAADLDELRQVGQEGVRPGQAGRVHVAPQDHVVGEEFGARRQVAQRALVLLGVPGGGVEEHRTEFDRLVADDGVALALQQHLQEAELVPRRRFEVEHFQPAVFGHEDDPFEAVVARLGLAGLGRHFDDERLFAGLLGDRRELDRERLARRVEGDHHPGALDELVPLALRQNHGDGHGRLAVADAARGQAGLENQRVALQDDLLGLQVGQDHVGRLAALAEADEVQRHPGPRGLAAGLGQVVAARDDAVGVGDDGFQRAAAEGFQHGLQRVAEAGLFAVGRERRHRVLAGFEVARFDALGDEFGLLGDGVDVDLDLLLGEQAVEQAVAGAGDEELGQAQAVEGGEVVQAAELGRFRADLGVLEVVHGCHAQARVEQDRHVRPALAVEGQSGLRQHEEEQHPERGQAQQQRQQHGRPAAGGPAFEAVQGGDQHEHGRADAEDDAAVEPRALAEDGALFEPPARPLAGRGRRHADGAFERRAQAVRGEVEQPTGRGVVRQDRQECDRDRQGNQGEERADEAEQRARFGLRGAVTAGATGAVVPGDAEFDEHCRERRQEQPAGDHGALRPRGQDDFAVAAGEQLGVGRVEGQGDPGEQAQVGRVQLAQVGLAAAAGAGLGHVHGEQAVPLAAQADAVQPGQGGVAEPDQAHVLAGHDRHADAQILGAGDRRREADRRRRQELFEGFADAQGAAVARRHGEAEQFVHERQVRRQDRPVGPVGVQRRRQHDHAAAVPGPLDEGRVQPFGRLRRRVHRRRRGLGGGLAGGGERQDASGAAVGRGVQGQVLFERHARQRGPHVVVPEGGQRRPAVRVLARHQAVRRVVRVGRTLDRPELAGQDALAVGEQHAVVPLGVRRGVRPQGDDDPAAALQVGRQPGDFGGRQGRHVAQVDAIDAGQVAQGRVGELAQGQGFRPDGVAGGAAAGRFERVVQVLAGPLDRVGRRLAVDQHDRQRVADFDGQGAGVVGRQVVGLDEFELHEVQAGVAEPGAAGEGEGHARPLAGRDRLDDPRLDRQHDRVRPARRRPAQRQFQPHRLLLAAAEVLHGRRDRRRGVHQGDRIRQRQIDDGDVLRLADRRIDDGDFGPRQDAPPDFGHGAVGLRQQPGPGGLLHVGEEHDLPPGEAARRPAERVGDHRQPRRQVGRAVRHLEGAQLGEHLFGVGRRPGDDGLRAVGQEDQREAVAGVGRLDGRFDLGDGVVEAGAVLVPRRHA